MPNLSPRTRGAGFQISEGEIMDEHTAKFLDAQDEAAGIPKDSKDSWRAPVFAPCHCGMMEGSCTCKSQPSRIITKQPIETMAIHLPVAKGAVKIKPDGSVEIPEGISTDAAADAFWQAVKAKGLADAQAQRIRALEERVEGAEKVISKFEAHYPMGINPYLDDASRAARAYFAARTKAGEPHAEG